MGWGSFRFLKSACWCGNSCLHRCPSHFQCLAPSRPRPVPMYVNILCLLFMVSKTQCSLYEMP
jgi:hypothetical protein